VHDRRHDRAQNDMTDILHDQSCMLQKLNNHDAGLVGRPLVTCVHAPGRTEVPAVIDAVGRICISDVNGEQHAFSLRDKTMARLAILF